MFTLRSNKVASFASCFDDVFVVSVKTGNPVIALRQFINRVCAVSVLLWRIPVPSAGVQPALSSDYLERHLLTVGL